MEKTAMQIVIDNISNLMPHENTDVRDAYQHAINIINNHKPTEQQQITDAFAAGHIDGMTDPENLSCYQPSDYFTTKYQ
jgi:hypothetical protein